MSDVVVFSRGLKAVHAIGTPLFEALTEMNVTLESEETPLNSCKEIQRFTFYRSAPEIIVACSRIMYN